ncbi:MAG: tail fiber domain-containing protein [Thermodesulfobacteriota bacterium]|jgi:hypothetical protein
MKKFLVVLMAVAVLTGLMAVPVFAADKLVVMDAGGTNAVFVVQDTGNTGVGTATPTAQLQVGATTPPNIGIPWNFYGYSPAYTRYGIDSGNNNSGFEFLESGARQWFMGSYSGKFAMLNIPHGLWGLVTEANGNAGLGVYSPAYPFEVGTSGTNGNGAYLSAGGVWTNGSSKEFKEDIHSLSAEQAIETVKNLQAVTFAYKVDPSEKHVGFIAEDVPDLVATKDRKHLSPMDIVAVLTKVVQEQSKTIETLSSKIDMLEKASKTPKSF